MLRGKTKIIKTIVFFGFSLHFWSSEWPHVHLLRAYVATSQNGEVRVTMVIINFVLSLNFGCTRTCAHACVIACARSVHAHANAIAWEGFWDIV